MESDRKLINRMFENELDRANEILNTEFSFDLAEPNYLVCLALITGHEELKSDFESSLIRLFRSKKIDDEPIAYLMYRLRWEGVRNWAVRELKELDNPMIEGCSLQKILDAFEDGWGHKDFYNNL